MDSVNPSSLIVDSRMFTAIMAAADDVESEAAADVG